jgi:hypothetical protein
VFRSTPIPSTSSSTTSPAAASAVAVLEDAARPDRPGAEHVARDRARVPRRLLDDRAHEKCMSPSSPRERSSPFTRATIDGARAVELVRRDDDGPSDVAKSLPFAGRARPSSPPLEVARRPVVHHREAADLAVGPMIAATSSS